MLFAASLPLLSAALAGFSSVSAHPHIEPGSIEHLRREAFQINARRSLAGCQDTLSRRHGVYERAIARREALAMQARKDKALRSNVPFKRDLDEVLATNHHSNLTGVTNDTDASILFAGNTSCVLASETTEGPYYVQGEFVRWDLREGQAGVDMYVDIQLIDVSTCEPVPGVFLDFWHANATGVYGGVVASGNGNNNDTSNIDATFLRGIETTNEDGVAQWLSIFPGHYTGRTTHIHIAAYQNGTTFDNGTHVAETVSHVGQVFFDQDLITEVEATEPYVSNTQVLTTNEQDGIMEGQASNMDPVLQYVYLGDSLADGLMMWGAVGIDAQAAYTITPAVILTEDGGVVNPDAPSGPPGGPPPAETSA